MFRGVAVALVTLFDGSGDVDAHASAALAAQLVDAGLAAIVVCGTTGEPFTLTDDERSSLLRAVREAVGGRVPVIAGTGAHSARQAVALTRRACEDGADAVLTLSPPGALDVRPYYDAVAGAAGDVPVLGYHFPNVSAPGIPVDVLAQLPIVGCKDSSGDAARFLAELAAFDGALYTGSAALLHTAGALGAAGAIVALANAEPELCVAAFTGDADAQRAIAGPMAATAGRFPHGIKELTAARFATSTVARLA
jgi:dihydrodipicolinate synthase/N-acetylneuraminate lyase